MSGKKTKLHHGFNAKAYSTIDGSGGTIFDVTGNSGQLFSVTDSLEGEIFVVSDISGIPILTVDASLIVKVDGDLDLTDTSTNQLKLPTGSTANPSLTFGGEETGFYQTSSGVINVSIQGSSKWLFSASQFRATTTNAAYMKNIAATATNPIFTKQGDDTTGVGGIAGELSLIVGGIEGLRIQSDSSINIYGNLEVDKDVSAATFNSIALTTAGVATNYLDETGAYSVPPSVSYAEDIAQLDASIVRIDASLHNQVTFGTDNQIPIMNGTTDFNYSTGLSYDGSLNVIVEDPTTSTIINVATFTRASSGTPANNIGASIKLSVEAADLSVIPLIINHELVDSATGAEDSKISMSAYVAGVETEFMDVNTLSVALGYGAVASGNFSTAIGEKASATLQGVTALGRNATGLSTYTIAIGYNSEATGSYSIAMGYATKVTVGASGVAIGHSAKVDEQHGIAIGTSAGNTSGTSNFYGISIGSQANNGTTNIGTGAIAIGRFSAADVSGAIMMGYHTTTQTNSLANSFELAWDGSTQFKVGTTYGTQVTSNADPASNLVDASHGSLAWDMTDNELQVFDGTSWAAVGGGGVTSSGDPSVNQVAIFGGDGSIYGDPRLILDGSSLIALGTGLESTAIGPGSHASNLESTAIGPDAHALNNSTIAIGNNALATGAAAISIGGDTWSKATYSLAIGYNAADTIGTHNQSYICIGTRAGSGLTSTEDIGIYSIAMGNSATATAKGAISIGYYNQTTAQGAILMGHRTSARQTNSLAESFELAWENVTTFKVGTTYGTGITTNADPVTNLVDAAAGSMAWDTSSGELTVYDGASWSAVSGASFPYLTESASTTGLLDIAEFRRGSTGTPADTIAGSLSIAVESSPGVYSPMELIHTLRTVSSKRSTVSIKAYYNGSLVDFIKIPSTGGALLGANSTCVSSDTMSGFVVGGAGLASNSIAIGGSSEGGANGIGIGVNAGNSPGTHNADAINIGASAGANAGTSIGQYSIAIGSAAAAQSTGTISFGYNSRTTAQGAIMIGYHTSAQTNSLANSFEIAWDANGPTFKVGDTYGTQVTSNADPASNLVDASHGSLAWDKTDNELQIFDGTSWAAVGGGGGVTASGDPSVNQVAIFGGDGSIYGNPRLILDGSSLYTYSGDSDITSVAIGPFAATFDQYSLAVGYHAVTNGGAAVALGRNAVTKGIFSIAIGSTASTTTGSTNAIAIGTGATSDDNGSISIGHVAEAVLQNSLSLGFSASAQGLGSISIGGRSHTTANGAILIGYHSSDQTNSLANSFEIAWDGNGPTFKVGDTYGTQVTSNADPASNLVDASHGSLAWDMTDNELQIFDGTSWAAVGGGGGGDVTKVGTPLDNQVPVWTGDGTIEGSTNFTYDGSSLIVNGDGTDSISIGSGALAKASDVISIGTGAGTNSSGTTGASSISIGYSANGTPTVDIGTSSIAIGSARSRQSNSISIGNDADTYNTSGISIGLSSLTTGDYGIALGDNTGAAAGGAIGIGRRSNATAAGAIMMGYHSSNQTNSLANSFELAWDGNDPTFKVGDTYGTGITVNADPSANLVDAVDGGLVYDSSYNEFKGKANGVWIPLGHIYNQNADVSVGSIGDISSISVADYDGAFFDYVIKDSGGTNKRSGTIVSIWTDSSVNYNETASPDFGDTSDVTLLMDVSSGQARLRASVLSSNWNIKVIVRKI
jgi:hypothetical protein